MEFRTPIQPLLECQNSLEAQSDKGKEQYLLNFGALDEAERDQAAQAVTACKMDERNEVMSAKVADSNLVTEEPDKRLASASKTSKYEQGAEQAPKPAQAMDADPFTTPVKSLQISPGQPGPKVATQTLLSVKASVDNGCQGKHFGDMESFSLLTCLSC